MMYEVLVVEAERPSRVTTHEGWYYVNYSDRLLGCQRLSVFFRTRAEALRCRDVLIADDHRQGVAPPPAAGGVLGFSARRGMPINFNRASTSSRLRHTATV